jgi:hypothetical protein
MHSERLKFGAREAAWLVLAAGYGIMLWQSLPGHMSVDSVIELHEARFHTRENWGPAIYPWILGLFDRISPGTSLFVIVTALMLYGSWAALPLLRRRASWWLVPLAAGAVLTPQAIIYQGNVWHDVLFADTAILGFLCLAFAGRDWRGARPPWLPLAASVLLLAVAGLVRQNGIILLPIAAVTLAWIAWDDGWRRAIAWGAGWFAATAVVTAVLSVTALPQGPGLEKAHAQGFRALAAYDLLGAVKRDPTLALAHIEHESPAAAQAIRAVGPSHYSPRRIDYIDDSAVLSNGLMGLSTESLVGDWLELMRRRPDLYLATRAEVFRWVFATPVIDACLPVYLGVDGPEKQMRELRLQKTWGDREQRLFNYATWFYDTPVLSHVAFAALALALIAFLLLRRDPADKAVGGMLAGGLTFTATFVPLSLACDYRYLYFLDAAVLTGLLYVAADPRLRRRPLADAACGPEKRSTQAAARSSLGRRAAMKR